MSEYVRKGVPYEPEIFSKTAGSRNIKKGTVWVYGHSVCLLLLLGTGERLFDTFPVQGMLSALCYLFVGGLGMSAGMFRFWPEAERSEFFKTFTLLYHPGVWILAAASFLEKTGISAVRITESLHLVYIAGWSFLVAGMIVLVVILRGSRM